MDENKHTPTPEELKAEEEAQRESKEDEVRAAVIAEYGFDEANDTERIEKLTKERLEQHTKLSQAIGQKIKYRTAAQQKAADAIPPKPLSNTNLDPKDIDVRVNTVVASVLEQRELEEMDIPDEIKSEIKRIAAIQNVSVKKAARDPYIIARIDSHNKAQDLEEAAITRKHRSGGTSKKDWSADAPPDVDMTTPEGQKTYDEWKAWAIKQGA